MGIIGVTFQRKFASDGPHFLLEVHTNQIHKFIELDVITYSRDGSLVKKVLIKSKRFDAEERSVKLCFFFMKCNTTVRCLYAKLKRE